VEGTEVNYEHIRYSIESAIATITLYRPDRMNAWTATMEKEVRQAMGAAQADTAVRVIVLTGAGRAFCAGADMEVLKGITPSEDRGGENSASVNRGSDNRAGNPMPAFDMNRRADWQTRYAYFASIDKPVIAMINGACAGLGMVMALYCDLRFAADTAVFSTAFARRGLIAEHGISWTLPRIVGHANALDLLISARKVRAPEARDLGLVNKIFAPEQLRESVMAYALELATMVSPLSMAAIKKQLYEVPFQTLSEAVMTANQAMLASFKSDDFREGVAHYVEKRAPNFTGT
jgi:enoyl-CoA hydratase/carnithine racemase